MENHSEKRREPKSRFAVAALFLGTVTTVVSVLRSAPLGPSGYRVLLMTTHPALQITLVASLLVLSCAAFLIFFGVWLGYLAAMLAGFTALFCFVRIEVSGFPWANSWIALNLSDGLDTWDKKTVVAAKLTILSVALLVVLTTLCALRLLPARWTVRKTPVCQRTWPSFFFSLIFLAAWFASSVMPYRVPLLVTPGVGADLKILHVEKHGLHFHETEVAVMKDDKFGIGWTDRKLFEYQFAGRSAFGVMPHAVTLRALSLLQSPTLSSMQTRRAKALREWNAEGWYVLGTKGVLSFSSENRSEPPREVVDLFDESEKLPVAQTYSGGTIKDVCLGFCYDPMAALGFVYANSRCSISLDGSIQCQ